MVPPRKPRFPGFSGRCPRLYFICHSHHAFDVGRNRRICVAGACPETMQAAIDEWRNGHMADSFPSVLRMRSVLGRTIGMGHVQFQMNLMGGLEAVLNHTSALGAQIAEHAVIFIFDLLLMLFALFFLFRDGKKLLQYFDDLIPLEQNHKEKLMERIRDTITSVTRGWLLTALVQGVIAMASYFLVGAEGAVLLGALTAVSGLLPGIGTAIIWIPMGIFYLVTGAYLKGVFILVWGAFVVALFVDTISRPYLVGRNKASVCDAVLFPVGRH